LANIDKFDLKDIEKNGIQAEGVSLTELLTEVLKLDETKFKNQIEMKFKLQYKTDSKELK
jgi:hypothetical protein